MSGLEIKSEELELVQKIAAGQFGEVYLGICRGQKVAVKVLKKVDNEQLGKFKTEISIMRFDFIFIQKE